MVEALEQRDVPRALDKALHVPVAGISTASMLNDELQVDLLFLGGVIALRGVRVFRSAPFWYPVDRRIPRRLGLPSATRGSGRLAELKASRWMKAGNGEMRRGRFCVRAEGLNCNYRCVARAAGFLSAPFLIAWSRAIALSGCRFRRDVNGALIPSFRGAGNRPINWFADLQIRRLIGSAYHEKRVIGSCLV